MNQSFAYPAFIAFSSPSKQLFHDNNKLKYMSSVVILCVCILKESLFSNFQKKKFILIHNIMAWNIFSDKNNDS